MPLEAENPESLKGVEKDKSKEKEMIKAIGQEIIRVDIPGDLEEDSLRFVLKNKRALSMAYSIYGGRTLIERISNKSGGDNSE